MSDTTTSPNMNLPVPVVSTDPGPDWANNLNSCINAIDSHTHAPGYGVAITPSGLNINEDLPMGNNSLTGLESSVYQAQSSLTTLKAVYVSGVDLYYNDGSGNTIRITQSGSVAGASGTITGLPSGTASASYQSVGGTFRFQSATNTAANIDGATIIVREQAASTNGISIKSPTSLGANYDLTLPTGTPAATKIVQMTSAGALSAALGTDNSTIEISANNLQVKNAGITAAKLGLNYFNGYFGTGMNWSTTSATYVDGTNSGGNTLTVRSFNGMTVTAGASSVCGITWTPSASNALYIVFVWIGLGNTNANTSTYVRLYDGTSVWANGAVQTTVNNFAVPVNLTSIYAPNTASAVTLKLQFATSANTMSTKDWGVALTDNVQWTLIQIA